MILVGASNDNWTLTGVGIGMFVGSLPLRPVPRKKIHDSYDMYNAGIAMESTSPKINLAVTENRVGIVIEF